MIAFSIDYCILLSINWGMGLRTHAWERGLTTALLYFGAGNFGAFYTSTHGISHIKKQRTDVIGAVL